MPIKKINFILFIVSIIAVLKIYFVPTNGINEINNKSNNKLIEYINASYKLDHKSLSSMPDTISSPGICIEDINNDGKLDIFIPGIGYSNAKPEFIKYKPEGNTIFINNGNDENNLPNFINTSEISGIKNLSKLGVGCTIVDFDNDGLQDILVTNSTRGVFNSAYGMPYDSTGNRLRIFPPEKYFFIEKTEGKYNFPEEGGVTLFKNMGINKEGIPIFKDITIEAGLTRGGSATSSAWADINNDGYLDLLVLNYSDPDFSGFSNIKFGGGFNILYKNNGDGTFEDVSEKSNLMGVGEYVYNKNQTKQFGWDINEKDSKGKTIGDPAGNSFAAVFTDFDGDLLPDVIVADDAPGRIRLFKNLGDFKFKDVSEKNDMEIAGNWMGLGVGDIDGDGSEDIFATNSGGPFGSRYRMMNMEETYMGDILNPPNKATLYNHLWINENGKFKNISRKTNIDWGKWKPDIDWLPPKAITGEIVAPEKPSGIEEGEFGFGALIFDHDNDGLNDIAWIGSLMRSTLIKERQFGDPNIGNAGRLLKNTGDGNFLDISKETGLLDLRDPANRATYQNGRGLAKGDINGDGYNDVIMTNAGGWDSDMGNIRKLNIGKEYIYVGLAKEFDPGPTFLYIASGGTNNWIKFNLVGSESNKDGIGSKISISYKEDGRIKTQTKYLRAGESYASQSAKEIIFGIGESKEIETATITWPNGEKTSLTNKKANQLIIVNQ